MYCVHYYTCTCIGGGGRGGFNSVIYVPCTLLYMYTSIFPRYNSDFRKLSMSQLGHVLELSMPQLGHDPHPVYQNSYVLLDI